MKKPINHRSPRPETWVLLLLALAFLAGLPGIFTWPAERILFNPQEYKQALDRQAAVAQLPALAGRLLVGEDETFLALRQDAYARLVSRLFPPAWVQSQADALIDQFWAYFNFQAPAFHLWLDIRPIKALLSGPDAPGIASILVEGLPDCTAEQILEYTLQTLLGQAAELPLCRPPDALLGPANFLAGALLQGTAQTLPDQIDLVPVLDLPLRLTQQAALGQGVNPSAPERAFMLYRLYRQTNPYLPITALLLLGAAGLLARRTARGPRYWLGLGLLLPGLPALLVALLAGLWITQGAQLLAGRLLGGNLLLFDLLVKMLAQVGGRFALAAGGIALGVTLLGAGLLWWGLKKSAEPLPDVLDGDG